MEPAQEGSSASSSSTPDESIKERNKASTLPRAHKKTLTKGVKQFFGNQKNDRLHITLMDQNVGEKTPSLLRSYVIPADDDLSTATQDDREAPRAGLWSRRQLMESEAEKRRPVDQQYDAGARFPIRRRFIPRVRKQSPAVGKKPRPPDDPGKADPEALKVGGRPQGRLHNRKPSSQLEALSNAGAIASTNTPSLVFQRKSIADSFLTEDSSNQSLYIRKKTKMKVEDQPRFSFQTTLSKIRGTKKEKAEQQEVSSPVRSHSPLTFSVDESAILESQDSLEEVASSENVKGERGQLQQRILKLTEQVRVQQANRNANLSEYLHLVSNADRIQAHRLKQAFEKRNQSLSSVITQLQRKLEHYVKRQQDLDRGLSPLPSKDLSRIITQGLQHTGRGLSDDTQDGPASGSMLSTDSSTSRSNLLVDTKSDTQDFTNLKASDEPQQESFRSLYRPIQPSLQPTMIDDQYSMVTASSEEPLDMSDITSPRSNSLDRQNLGFLTVLEELTEVKEKQLNLELNFKNMAERYNQDYLAFEESLQEERYRSDQLQAELNDLIDLHQNEVLNLKSELASLEEKIAYQSYESSRDIWEVLEAFQTKMIRLEQLQQVAQVEVLDHPNTRELLGKSMNLLLIIFAVVLMLMSTISALILPFVKTRTRAVTTSMVIVLLIVVWHNWEFFSTLIPRRLIYHWR